MSEVIRRGYLGAVALGGVETNVEGASYGESIVIPLTGTELEAPKYIMDLGMG